MSELVPFPVVEKAKRRQRSRGERCWTAAGGPAFDPPIQAQKWVPRPCVFCKGGYDAPTAGDFSSILCHPISKRNLSPSFIHLHGSCFAQQIMPITAPSPLLRRLHQSSFHRIAMHVPQLLHPLLRRPHIEVIETRLPERPPSSSPNNCAAADRAAFAWATTHAPCAASAPASPSTDFRPPARSSADAHAPA